MNDELVINEIVTKLSEAQEILTKEIPSADTDMDVSRWNATPVGKAVHRIQHAINLILED